MESSQDINEILFDELFNAPTEDAVDEIISKYPALFLDEN